MARRTPRVPARHWWYGLVALAAAVYPPLLMTERGQVVADTKSYLYLDPGRLLSRATSMWDPHVGLGTVPHQQIGFLWPMGPWFWVTERLGIPDWVSQRLWIGTIVLAAAAGVLFLARTWRWHPVPATAAAWLYALSPFVLTLAARISVILLPFVGLPWLLALTVRALRHRGWRHPALFGLAVATIGGVNATALLLVGLAPLLWIAYSCFASREVTPARGAVVAAKIGACTLGASLWWIAGLSVQATHGIDVLRYTETAEVVARASQAPEVLRGLGYWFFYGGDRLGPWIEPSVDYTQRLWLIGLTYLLPSVGLLALGVVRWRYRAFTVALLLLGTVVAVGAHPWDQPSPVGHVIKAFLLTDAGLAMRSLPRAVPLVALALALGTGSLIGALRVRVPARALLGAVVVCGLALLALPPLWMREFVPENLRRPEDVPSYWVEAASFLDERGPDTRILEIPGTDFASYRWGNTVDPITPGLLDRPYVARELIPQGSAASADLLNALDLRLQERTLDPRALAPMARVLAAGDVVTRNDLQYERYNTPRPRTLWDLVRRARGIGDALRFGPDTPNVPVPAASLVDEHHLSGDRGLPDPPAVGVHPVSDPVPIVRAAAARAEVVLSGDGAGVVDAAMAGLIDGSEVLRYSASLAADAEDVEDEERSERLGAGATLPRRGALVITDTNRRRGERWTTVRHTQGYTESAEGGILREDLLDNRLPVLPDIDGSRTVSEIDGLSVRASDYGNPITYEPSERPARAFDGDLSTAWRTGGFSDAVGQRIEVAFDDRVTTGSVRLTQPQTGEINRWITRVRLRFDGGRPLEAELHDDSRGPRGQSVTFPARSFRRLSVEILADTAGRPPGFSGFTSVGFAEIDVAGRHGQEWVRMPTDLFGLAGPGNGGAARLGLPLAIVQTRQRAAADDPTRNDEEFGMRRILRTRDSRSFSVSGTVRLSARAADRVLQSLLAPGPGGRPPGTTASASSRLPGGLAHLPVNVSDGDPTTVWTSRFGDAVGEWVEVTSPVRATTTELTVAAVDDPDHSVPTTAALSVDGLSVPVVTTAGPTTDGRRILRLRTATPVTGSRFRVTFTAVERRTTIDWNSQRPRALPVAVGEIGFPAPGVPLAVVPEVLDTGCRNDLVTVDRRPVPVRITGTTADARAGRELHLAGCGRPVELRGGEHRFAAAEGRTTGLDIDQLVWRSAPGGDAWVPPAPAGPADRPVALLLEPQTSEEPVVRVTGGDDATVRIRVTEIDPGRPFWVVLRQSANPGWALDGPVDAEGPRLVDGYANGWLVTADEEAVDLTLRFAPQDRVDLALVASAIFAALLVLLSLTPAPAIVAPPDPAQEPVRRLRALRYEGVLPARRHAWLVTGCAGLAGALVVNPAAGLAVAFVTFLTARRETWRSLLTVVPALLLAGCGAYVMTVQFRNGIGPGLHWPHDLGRVHPYGLTAVVLLVVDVVIDRLWRGPSGADAY